MSVSFVIATFIAITIVGIITLVFFPLQGNQWVAGLKRDQLVSE